MSMPNPIVLLDARARYVHPAFQMTRASTKTVFDATGKLVTVPANALGWDHDPATGQARGYLAEPSGTNLLLHSNDLTVAWGQFQATVTGNAITGPDGNGMAKITETVSSGQHTVYKSFTITDGSPVAVQCIARAGERSNVELRLQQASDNTNFVRMVANLFGGTGVTNAGGSAIVAGGAVKYLGGGFYHISVWGELGSGITDARFLIAIRDENNSLTYEGDGTSGLYVGYCQAEEGSYPTSYIPTGAATATRASDALMLPDISAMPWWRASRGTIVVDVAPEFISYDRRVFSLSGDIELRWRVSADQLVASGTKTDGFAIARDFSSAPLQRSIIAVAWDEEQVQVASDGTLRQSVNITSTFSPINLGIGAQPGGGNPVTMPIRRVVYSSARISNADLQSLTAIQE